MSVRRLCIFALLFILSFTSGTLAQNPAAEVKRKVNLRSGPSMTTQKKVVLQRGDELQVLELQAHDGFYHVQTEDGYEGWVAAKNISIKEEPPELASSGNGAPAEAISANWEK